MDGVLCWVRGRAKRQPTAKWVLGFAVLAALCLALSSPRAWAWPQKWGTPLPSFYTEIDWDYPFILEGFDQDILTCASIVPRFEGNKLVLRCEGTTEEAPAAQTPKSQPPAFDAASYLEKRYHAPKGSTGPLKAPFVLADWMVRKKRGGLSPDPGLPADGFQYPVPASCQTFFQDGEWRTVLMVVMYYRPKDLPDDTKRIPNKGNFYGLLPYYTNASVFSCRQGAWKLLKESQGFLSYSSIACPYPGRALWRLWRLPTGEHVLLRLHDIITGISAGRSNAQVYAYRLRKDGSIEADFDKLMATRYFEGQPDPEGQFSRLCALQVPQTGETEFSMFCRKEIQRVDEPLWISNTTKENASPYKREKLSGVPFPSAWY